MSADAWAWLDEIQNTEDGTPGPTPRAIAYVRKLGVSTRDEIARLEETQEADTKSLREDLADVKQGVSELPEKVAKLAFDQAYQERELKKQALDAKLKLVRFVSTKAFEAFGVVTKGIFDSANTLFTSNLFTVLLGVSLVLASAGIFAGQTGLTLTREGLIIDPSEAAPDYGESEVEDTKPSRLGGGNNVAPRMGAE